MRRCFLHIGTHKTGSTSIQVSLKQSREALARRGYLYPAAGTPPGSHGQHNIGWQLRGDRRFSPEPGTIDDLLEEIDRTGLDVVLSSEDLECTTENLSSLVGKLEERGFAVSIVVYLREQADYAKSLYIELTRHGLDRTFGEFVAEIVADRKVRWKDWVFYFDYRAMLATLPESATLMVRPFSRSEPVIPDFLSILGLAPVDVGIDPLFRVNEQQPVGGAVAAFCCNSAGRRFEDESAATMELLACALDGAKPVIGETTRRELIAALDDSNRWVDASFGLRLAALANEAPVEWTTDCIDLEDVFSRDTLCLVEEFRERPLSMADAKGFWREASTRRSNAGGAAGRVLALRRLWMRGS